MRTSVHFFSLVGALLLGGCVHPTPPPPPPPASATATLAPAVAPQRLHIYVDGALPAESPERNRALAETIALTLRDQLRQRGYDVRGAESMVRLGAANPAPGDALAQLSLLVRTVAAGSLPPPATRYATYLHTNAPRLLLFASLQPGAAATLRQATELRLGGLLVDSATGEILWSGTTSARTTSDDPNVRRLAAKLLVGLAPQP